MENASEALKMAFAVLVFIIALSIVFHLITEVKDTADAVLFYSDKTNYYTYETGTLDKNGRIVGIDTVISTLKNEAFVIIEEDKYKTIEFKNNSVIIKETGDTTEFSNRDEKVQEYITRKINNKDKYYEKITQITTAGVYRTAEDGTRITIKPGTTRTYIIYTKI